MSSQQKSKSIKGFHNKRFPGEKADYREARNRLIKAEIELRRHVEDVARLRRELPLGGKLKKDYIFDEGGADLDDFATVKQTRFSELFEGDKNSLVVYCYMFPPGAELPCPMCTSFIDSLEGAAQHIEQRVNLAIIAKASIEELRDFARSRHWTHLRLLSSMNNSFNVDYHSQRSDDDQMPVLHVFERRGNGIHHFYSTEIVYVEADPGQNQRHIDMMWPLWNVFDMVREGRGADWFPSVSYTSS